MDIAIAVGAMSMAWVISWFIWLQFRLEREKLQQAEYERQHRWLVEQATAEFERSPEQMRLKTLQAKRDLAQANRQAKVAMQAYSEWQKQQYAMLSAAGITGQQSQQAMQLWGTPHMPQYAPVLMGSVSGVHSVRW